MRSLHGLVSSHYSDSENSFSKRCNDELVDDVFTDHELSIANTLEVNGRRIADIRHLLLTPKDIKHAEFGCSFFDINITFEKHFGLRSVFTYRCDVCGREDSFSTEASVSEINEARYVKQYL